MITKTELIEKYEIEDEDDSVELIEALIEEYGWNAELCSQIHGTDVFVFKNEYKKGIKYDFDEIEKQIAAVDEKLMEDFEIAILKHSKRDFDRRGFRDFDIWLAEGIWSGWWYLGNCEVLESFESIELAVFTHVYNEHHYDYDLDIDWKDFKSWLMKAYIDAPLRDTKEWLMCYEADQP